MILTRVWKVVGEKSSKVPLLFFMISTECGTVLAAVQLGLW